MHQRPEQGAARDVSTSIRPGDVLAGRYLLEDLLDESRGARFWRAHDRVLARHVAVHVIDAADERAEGLLAAARASATVTDRHLLRVLDADRQAGLCFVVNEWGAGTSLDIVLSGEGPLDPRRAAWIVAEVADAVAAAHQVGVSHGRLVPESVLLDHHGSVRVIGLAVDAALHGLPPGRRSTDVTDLAGLLYAGLTGRWAGISPTLVPRAPVVAGRVLRPRQVRAGIPRPLDTLCDTVLDPAVSGGHARAAYDLTTARGIAACLHDFVGDPGGLATPTRPQPPAHPSFPAPAPPVPAGTGPVADGPDADGPGLDGSGLDGSGLDGGPDTEPGGEPVDEGPPTAPTPVVELPTQAGLPIFDDADDEVTWLTPRAHRPPPPPPFEPPAARPLFAPDPRPGTPARSPRPGAAETTGTGTGTGSVTGSQEFWPWTAGDSGTFPGPVAPVDAGEPAPGSRWLHLAMVIAAAALLLLGIVVVAKLAEGGGSPDAPGTTPSGSPAQTGALTPLSGLVADDLDPQGDPPEENPDLVGAAVDGDPATSWRTATYEQDLGPGGLKRGVGLTVDLGADTEPTTAVVTFRNSPTTASLFLTTQRPSSVGGLTPVVTASVDQRLAVDFDPGSTGRFFTVWLTSLPAVAGGFRGEIVDVVVTG